jgi:hypothetical protein
MINKELAGARPRERRKPPPCRAQRDSGGGGQAGLETNAHPNRNPSRCFQTLGSLLGTSSRPDNGHAGRSCEPLCVLPVRNKTKAPPLALPYLLRTAVVRACRTLRAGPAARPRPLETTTSPASFFFSKRLGSQVASRGEVQQGVVACGYPKRRRSDIFPG